VTGGPHELILHPASTPEGPRSVSGAPNLREGFTDTFTSRYIDTGGLRQHAVIGGAESWGEAVGNGIKPAADDVQTVVIPGPGHWVAEQAPEEMLAALTAFLAPYRDGG
jgi:pimeloyl-ACP methyl ester carboxylesterase